MASVFDVAEYILSKKGPMTAMKLQKLVYYAQAWSLVWDEKAMFSEELQAWVNGPVVPDLFDRHRGQFTVAAGAFAPPGDVTALSQSQRDTIDAILRFYGDRHSQWLSDLTHSERPWREARGNLPPTIRGNRRIDLATMHEYYSGLKSTIGNQS